MGHPRRVLVSAGDPSGDLILASVIRHIREMNPDGPIEFVGLCGPASEKEGARAIASAKEIAVVGLVEVIRNLSKIFDVLGRLRRELPKCDSVICVDFPDFNLKLAELAFKQKVPVDYIIAPQVWAWRRGRIGKMSQLIRRLYPALPFEEEMFRDGGVNAQFLGHPIRDLLPPKARREARAESGFEDGDFVTVLMPGSRKSEVRKHLPLLIESWNYFLKLEKRAGSRRVNRAILPLAPGWTAEDWRALIDAKSARVFNELVASGAWRLANDSRRALMTADFGWIVSGTATLEAALYQVPHILIYRLSRVSELIIKSMSHYFSDPEANAGLPNILLGKSVIPELLQDRVTAKQLAIESFELLHNAPRLNEITKSLRFLPKKLGEAGATQRIAADLLSIWGREKKTV